MPSPIIETRHLSLQIAQKTIFHDISLAFPHRQVSAIIGPSGSGKSSFLCCLNRLTDLQPDIRLNGHIYWHGQSLHDPNLKIRRLRRRIGMLFQQANPFPMSIRKNIDLPLRDWGVTDKQQRRHKIEEALTKVGLWSEVCHRLEDSALQLSGGQKQRLCLARTIALDPEVLLMDEPCSALDPMASARIEQLIHKLKEEITIIIVTHNLAQAKRVADQVHLFWFDDEKKGHIIESAEREAFFRTPQQALTRSYLEGAIG